MHLVPRFSKVGRCVPRVPLGGCVPGSKPSLADVAKATVIAEFFGNSNQFSEVHKETPTWDGGIKLLSFRVQQGVSLLFRSPRLSSVSLSVCLSSVCPASDVGNCATTHETSSPL